MLGVGEECAVECVDWMWLEPNPRWRLLALSTASDNFPVLLQLLNPVPSPGS